MIKRFGRLEGIVSFVVPACFYSAIAAVIFFSIWPYFYYVKNETLIVLGIFALWRYSWLVINYVRAALYAFLKYPALKDIVAKIKEEDRYPDRIFFVIASYKEEPWVSIEMIQSILSNMASIPSKATIIISTGADLDDAVLSEVFNAHPVSQKVDLVLQRQSQGKRIALGHALRAVARRYKDEPNSVTVVMDGDSYLETGTLKRSIPFFSAFNDLGALTTNEVAYINTTSQWYKDWFNLKFGQRNMMFQSHSLSNKVLTLTGRFSVFRTSIVTTEKFIQQVENDSITHWQFGRFRFLMGDDKSTWFYLLKEKWSMLYLPDVKVYSLESRDANFWEISTSLPFRWHGNTLRNNTRALALGPEVTGWFIWFAILDQRLTMWTSLVGLTGATVLSIMKSFIYLPFYIFWVLTVRIIQMGVIAFMGHPVSVLTIPLMLYNQWVGSLVKIKAFYNLANQSWSKGKTNSSSYYSLKHSWLAKILPTFRHALSYMVFVSAILIAHGYMATPAWWLVKANSEDLSRVVNAQTKGVTADDGIDDAAAIQALIDNADPSFHTTIMLPAGDITLNQPLVIDRSNLTLKGQRTTRLIASFTQSDEKAVINVKGSVIDNDTFYVTKVAESVVLADAGRLTPGDVVLMFLDNNDQFLASIGSENWNKPYPQLRRLMNVVQAVDGEKVDLLYPLPAFFDDVSVSVRHVEDVRNVTLQNFTLQYVVPGASIDLVQGQYENLFPQHQYDGISMDWSYGTHIENVRVFEAGSDPLSIENSLGCHVESVHLDGAWNKGKEGNGYLKLSKSHYCTLTKVKVENIRHVGIQWGASQNQITMLHSTVDINFHGGYAHDNYVEGVVNLPDYHPWPAVYRTPDDAGWAPPDGPNNRVRLIR